MKYKYYKRKNNLRQKWTFKYVRVDENGKAQLFIQVSKISKQVKPDEWVGYMAFNITLADKISEEEFIFECL